MNPGVQKVTARMLALVVVVFTVTGLWLAQRWARAAAKARFVSCLNHRNRLHICADEISLRQREGQRTPPYLLGADGAMLWAAVGRNYSNLNCHHGAPNKRFGGWQGVNLSSEKWHELARRWPYRSHPSGIPVYWCGGPDPSQRRAFTTVIPHFGERPSYQNDLLSEADCARYVATLNETLTAMGERPVPLNVPENVDWDKAPAWPTPAPSEVAEPAVR